MKNISEFATIRYRKGFKTYGTFNPETDTRDLSLEFDEEIADAYNYVLMMYQKYGECEKWNILLQRLQAISDLKDEILNECS